MRRTTEEAVARNERWLVFLNGEQVQRAEAFDTDEGWVRHSAQRDDGRWEERTSRGIVTVTYNGPRSLRDDNGHDRQGP